MSSSDVELRLGFLLFLFLLHHLDVGIRERIHGLLRLIDEDLVLLG